jgi:heat shock protein HtpX
MYGAKPVTAAEYPALYSIVRSLSTTMDMPMPKIYIINMETPNAFATGRSPDHAAVAVSPSLLEALKTREVEAVIAHELSHVRNRDILVATIAATMVTTITFVARMAQFAAMFGGGRGRSSDRDEQNPLGLLILVILAPIAALLVQLAITRTREYMADEGSGRITNRPGSLISALEKISGYAKKYPVEGTTPTTAHMFIVNPWKESLIVNMFSTHPN